jgi:hypothetical protein
VQLLRKMNNQLNVLSQSSPSTLELQLPHFNLNELNGELSHLKGKRVLFRTDYSKECIPYNAFRGSRDSIGDHYFLREFSPLPRERAVVGIDSSCALIGETEDGSIYAGRSAMVCSVGSKIITYRRLGPVIFYLGGEILHKGYDLNLPRRVMTALLLEHRIGERFVRTLLERWMQFQAAEQLSDAIVLVDGSLRSSILEPRGLALKEIERRCERNFNQVLGISKASTLKIISTASSELSSSVRGGVFFDLTEIVRALLASVRNRVLIVKFASNSPVFRVDASKSNGDEDSQVLADLKFNDLLHRGYPETLRLAHHLSVFDSALISSIRSYLSRKYELTPVPSDDLRAMILGRLV